VKPPLPRSSWFDRLAVAALAAASLVALAAIGFAPRAGAAVGVVYAPWTSAPDALARAVAAGARFVRFGAAPFIVVVMPEAADYAAQARAGGALFTLDPQALAACLPGDADS